MTRKDEERYAIAVGLAHAVDERGAQQIGPGEIRVGRGAAELVMIAPAHGRVALLEKTAVADGLRLGVLHRDVAALALVAVELLLARIAAQDARPAFPRD